MKVNFDIFICLDVSKSWTIPGSLRLWCMHASLGMQCQCNAFYARLFTLNYKKIYQLALKYSEVWIHEQTYLDILRHGLLRVDRIESFSGHFVWKSRR